MNDISCDLKRLSYTRGTGFYAIWWMQFIHVWDFESVISCENQINTIMTGINQPVTARFHLMYSVIEALTWWFAGQNTPRFARCQAIKALLQHWNDCHCEAGPNEGWMLGIEIPLFPGNSQHLVPFPGKNTCGIPGLLACLCVWRISLKLKSPNDRLHTVVNCCTYSSWYIWCIQDTVWP